MEGMEKEECTVGELREVETSQGLFLAVLAGGGKLWGLGMWLEELRLDVVGDKSVSYSSCFKEEKLSQIIANNVVLYIWKSLRE